jgi:hypothetical protein
LFVVISAFRSEKTAFSAVKAEISVDRAAFAVVISGMNAFTARITTHRAISTALMSKKTTVKSDFTGENPAFTRNKARITTEVVALSRFALATTAIHDLEAAEIEGLWGDREVISCALPPEVG